MLRVIFNELTNTVDTTRKQLDDLYSLYDTLQATRLSGRGSTTAGPMLAEILKGIEKTQGTQQNAQAELSALAATLADRAMTKV
ncbi:MAG: hypothetical protein EBV23_11580, partial [Flavobacteriia bacterium]|nr:hypothetical protein [Flavobacteriia bacterium]